MGRHRTTPFSAHTMHWAGRGRGVFRVRMRKVMRAHKGVNISFLLGPSPKVKNELNEWKNHFSEMKRDVGMSHHEKGREQDDAYTKTESHS